MNLYFKKAMEIDINEISALYSAAIGTDGCTWSLDYPNSEITKGDYERGDLFCIKTEKGEIVGAISVDDDKEVEGLSCWSKELEPAAELARLVVKREFQNKGIARMLLAGAMDVLRERGYQGVHFGPMRNFSLPTVVTVICIITTGIAMKKRCDSHRYIM